MAILDRYVPAVLQKLLPNGGWSKADCDEHAVDVRIQDRQPSPSIRLDERRRFYEGFRGLLLAWVSYLGRCHSMLFFPPSGWAESTKFTMYPATTGSRKRGGQYPPFRSAFIRTLPPA